MCPVPIYVPMARCSPPDYRKQARRGFSLPLRRFDVATTSHPDKQSSRTFIAIRLFGSASGNVGAVAALCRALSGTDKVTSEQRAGLR